jgi:hypothetical protein
MTFVAPDVGTSRQRPGRAKAKSGHVRYTFKIVITAIVGGLVGAVWMGFKLAVGKS